MIKYNVWTKVCGHLNVSIINCSEKIRWKNGYLKYRSVDVALKFPFTGAKEPKSGKTVPDHNVLPSSPLTLIFLDLSTVFNKPQKQKCCTNLK